MIRLLIVDDHPIVISGLQNALGEQGDIKIVGHVLNAKDALEWLGDNDTDVILLDIGLPDMDGIDLCKQIHKQFPEPKIIGLTTYGQVSFITSMLRNGAKGYLYKNTSEQELATAIRTVHGGGQYLSAEVNNKLIAKATRSLPKNGQLIPKLTRREKEVLELIMAESTNQEIADTLFLSISTVETHRMNLCAKLGARNTAGLVKNAIKLGLA